MTVWEFLFSLTNTVALIGWIFLAALPRKPLVLSAVLYLGVALLCLCYAAMVVALVSGWADPRTVPGAPQFDFADYSITGLRALFMSDGGIVLGWTHYLAFDLFAGLWIARDADAKGFGRLVQVPFLLAIFISGPIGLLSWLVVRERRARKAARQG